MGAGSRPGPWANSRAGGGGGVVLRLAASLSDPAPVTWLFWASVSSPVLVARGAHTEWCSGGRWSRGGPRLRRCTWAPRRWGRRAPSPICSLPLEARGRHLGGGAGGPLRHYWLCAAPPSPAAGQHVRAGKGAGFKFENPGYGGGVERGTGPSAQAPGEGARTWLLRSRVCALACLPSAPVAPAGLLLLICREAIVATKTSEG